MFGLPCLALNSKDIYLFLLFQEFNSGLGVLIGFEKVNDENICENQHKSDNDKQQDIIQQMKRVQIRRTDRLISFRKQQIENHRNYSNLQKDNQPICKSVISPKTPFCPNLLPNNLNIQIPSLLTTFK